MNIAAFWHVVRRSGLSGYPKLACVVLAGHASRYTLTVQMSTAEIAAEMGVSYDTARRALKAAVEAKCLTVDKSHGRGPIWTLQGVAISATWSRDLRGQVADSHAQNHHMDVLDIKLGDAAGQTSSPASGENPPVTCPDCVDHSGWLWRHDGVMRCPHG